MTDVTATEKAIPVQTEDFCECEKPHKEIFEYIRKRRGGKTHKVGIILGTIIDDTIRIGWSKCNVKEGDKFHLKTGMSIARSRTSDEPLTRAEAPKCIRRQVRRFGARCVRYFKDAKRMEFPS